MQSVRDRDRSPPPPWNVDDVTRAMSKGGVLVNAQEWVYFSIFGRADDVTWTVSRGVLVNGQGWGYFSIFGRADDVTWTMSRGVCL